MERSSKKAPHVIKSTKPITGFTLVEVLLSLSIVAILAALAVPSYLNYSRKAAFAELVQAADKYKSGVATCLMRTVGDETRCNGGEGEVPQNQTQPLGKIASITVADGVITVVPLEENGFTAEDTYVLAPLYSSSSVQWQTSGGACSKGYVACNNTNNDDD